MRNIDTYPSRTLAAICFALALALPARAQITNVTNATSTPTPGSGHDYIQMLSETVNPANGSLSLRIGAPIPPGRQLTLPFAFAYDSNGVEHLATRSTRTAGSKQHGKILA